MNNTLLRYDESHILYNGEKLKTPKYTYNDKKQAYWQSEIDKYSCSLHASLGAVGDNFDVFFTKKDRKEILAMAKERGFSAEFPGWYMGAAVECLRDWCNANMGLNIDFKRVSWIHYRKLMALGFSVVTGFNISIEQTKDKLDDGMLNFSHGHYGEPYLSHLIRLTTVDKHRNFLRHLMNKKPIYVDNYPNGKTKYNEVGLDPQNFLRYVEANALFDCGYIFYEK